MSIGKIIILIGICFGMLYYEKTKPQLLLVVLVGLILSFFASFFDGKIIFQFSFFSFGISVLLYFGYSLYRKSWLPAAISAFALTSFIFISQHWPYGSEIQISMLLPIALFIGLLFKFKKFENEISILAIIAAYEVSQFVQLFS